MRGGIQAPIVLHFGKSIHAGWALRCLATSSQATPAGPRLTSSRRALPVLRGQSRPTEPCLPRVTKPTGPRHACIALPSAALLVMPATPCRSSIAPGLATPCLQYHAEPCRSTPRLPVRSWPIHRCLACDAATGLATPCLACRVWPCLPFLAMPALPCNSMLDLALPRLPCRALHEPDHA